MNSQILRTPPHRLSLTDLQVLHENPALRDRYNHRWNTAFF